jgi:hypothetical protein
MKSTMIIIGRGLVVKLRRGDWNELTRHPKDRGRDRPNLRTNSLQPGKDDVDHIALKFMKMATCSQDKGRSSGRPSARPDP